MDAKLKVKWLRALRGKKYQQGNGELKCSDTFCCLGVLADIQGAEWFGGVPTINGEENNGMYYLRPVLAGGLRSSTQRVLALLNDRGKPFSEIADYIERRIK
jgi:hypothetical protein